MLGKGLQIDLFGLSQISRLMNFPAVIELLFEGKHYTILEECAGQLLKGSFFGNYSRVLLERGAVGKVI